MIRLPQDLSEAVELGHTVTVPTRQRSEALRLSWAAQALARGQQVWQTPDVLPLEAWKARAIERRAAAGEALPRLLSNAEEWLLWRQSAAQLTEALELVARGPLAEALHQASQLACEFQIDLTRLRNSASTESRLLYDVQRAVEARAQELRASTVSWLAPRLGALGDERPLIITGFAQPTPGTRALVAARSDRGFDTRVRIGDSRIAATARAVLAADPSEELERIAEWCRLRLNQQSDARLLVLAPGAPEARERLVTLIRQSLDPLSSLGSGATVASNIVALEGGLPLARAPLVAHALRSLEWLARGSEHSDFSAWLCAPFWGTPDAARARLDLWLRERCGLEIGPQTLSLAFQAIPDSLASDAQALLIAVRNAQREMGAGRASPRQWSERFASALLALGWPGRRTLDSEEEQTHVRFTELLDELGQLAAASASIPRESAIQWLSELASRTSFRPASGDSLVTVSAQLADPVVQYDGIWVAGLHADAWPQPVQPDAFLPLKAQVDAGVPAATSAGRAAEAHALMAAWSRAAGELVLSTPLRAEDVQLSPSPLLASLPRVPDSHASASIWLPLRIRREHLTETIEDTAGLVWDRAHRLPSGTRSIELQNLCPFRAYGELRLGSSELDAPEPGIAADLRGKLLHAALQKLWRVLKGSAGLQAQSRADLDALIERCVEQAASETMQSAPQTRAAVDRRECRRAVRLIRGLCELERKRAPFVVQHTELEKNFELAGAPLRVRIDRLDTLAQGGLAILDYKSGRPAPGDWYSERPSHPQLLAYLAAVGDATVAMATVNVTAREIRFDGIAADASLLPKVRAVEAAPDTDEGAAAWPYWQQQWRARVEHLASDFVSGRANVDPRPKACQYCQVVSLCRISDASATAVEQNVDD